MFVIICRTLVVYAFLMVIMRLMGKRQMGEMELSEFVVAALIADLAAYPLEEPGAALFPALLPIVCLFALELLIAWLSMRSIRLRALLYGTPSLLIDHGRLRQREMRRNRFTADELMQALRSQGILDINEVLYAILETNGTLNVVPIAECQPASAGQLGVAEEEAGYPCILISDGRILDRNLQRLGFNRVWLEKRMRERGIRDPRDVFLLTSDEKGNIFFAQRER